MVFASGYIIISIFLLYFGAEFSLNSAEKIGRKLGLSPLIIGMVLVGFGTSLPEFFVAHIAAMNNKMPMAIGSLVGSNISNLCLILGIGAFLTHLKTYTPGLSRHIVIHLFLVPVLFISLGQGTLTGLGVVLLIALSLLYCYVLWLEMRSSRSTRKREEIPDNMWLLAFKILIGFVFLYLGGEALVKGGTDMAMLMGIDEYIISAILLAFGTSLPELITSFIACIKKIDTDVIIGNIIGSNLFNCALIMGSLGFYEINFDLNLNTELAVLGIGSVLLLVFNLCKISLNRYIGAGYLGLYGYMIYIWVS